MKTEIYGYEAGKKRKIGETDKAVRTLRGAFRAVFGSSEMDWTGYRVLTIERDGVELDESSPGHGCSHDGN